MRGTGLTVLAIVLIVLVAAFGWGVLEGVAWTLLVLLVLLMLPVAIGAFWIWNLKRRVRRGIADFQKAMQASMSAQQAAAQRQARRPETPPGGPGAGPDVIDVQPTSVKDETR